MASSNRTIVTYWQKYGHLVLDNRLGSLHRKNVDRLTARFYMTLIHVVLTRPLILKTKQMICGCNCLWFHFIMHLFEPENN